MSRYEFLSPGAAAGDAMQRFLLQREARKRQDLLDSLKVENEQRLGRKTDADIENMQENTRTQAEARRAAAELHNEQMTDARDKRVVATHSIDNEPLEPGDPTPSYLRKPQVKPTLPAKTLPMPTGAPGVVAQDPQQMEPTPPDMLRADGSKKDANGFLGSMKRPDGRVSSEISAGMNIDGKETEIPTLVPGLSKEETDYLLTQGGNGNGWDQQHPLVQSILDKAVAHARPRIADGKSPFASPADAPTVEGHDIPQEMAPTGRETYKGDAKQRQEKQESDDLDAMITQLPPEVANHPGVRALLQFAKTTHDKQGVAAALATMMKEPKAPHHYSVDPKTNKMVDMGEVPEGSTFTTNPQPPNGQFQQDRMLEQSYRYHMSGIDKLRAPLEGQLERLQRLEVSLSAESPAVDPLIGPELLSAMAGGQGSGVRMSEAEIARLIGGRSFWEDLKAKLNHMKTDPNAALSITSAQRGQIQTLVREVNTRAQKKLAILDNAGDDLVAAGDLQSHKDIVQRAKKAFHGELTGAESKPGGGGGDPSVVEWERGPDGKPRRKQK